MCFLARPSGASGDERRSRRRCRYRDRIIAVGLDSAEVGNPPSKFRAVFDRARAEGLLDGRARRRRRAAGIHVGGARRAAKFRAWTTACAVWKMPHCVARLVRERMPLTVCPLSNVRLRVVRCSREHPLKRMLDAGLVARATPTIRPISADTSSQNFTSGRGAGAPSERRRSW